MNITNISRLSSVFCLIACIMTWVLKFNFCNNGNNNGCQLRLLYIFGTSLLFFAGIYNIGVSFKMAPTNLWKLATMVVHLSNWTIGNCRWWSHRTKQKAPINRRRQLPEATSGSRLLAPLEAEKPNWLNLYTSAATGLIYPFLPSTVPSWT